MRGLKIFGIILGVIVAFFVLIAFITSSNLGFRYFIAPFQGMVEKRETVQSGDYRIHAYETFFDRCGSIQGDLASLKAQQDILEQMEKGTQRYDKTLQNIASLKSQLRRNIAQYNADARKKETKAKHMSEFVPTHLSYQKILEKGHVSCKKKSWNDLK